MSTSTTTSRRFSPSRKMAAPRAPRPRPAPPHDARKRRRTNDVAGRRRARAARRGERQGRVALPARAHARVGKRPPSRWRSAVVAADGARRRRQRRTPARRPRALAAIADASAAGGRGRALGKVPLPACAYFAAGRRLSVRGGGRATSAACAPATDGSRARGGARLEVERLVQVDAASSESRRAATADPPGVASENHMSLLGRW